MITQEQFNTIYLGLQAQGFKRSFDEDRDMCRFRGPDNTKCAIGHLIPDAEYLPRMESWDHRIFYEHGMFTDMTDKEFRNLQDCHDDHNYPEEMQRAFIDYAADHNLTVPS